MPKYPSTGTSVLVLGASGMLGHTVLRFFAQSPGFRTVGSVRSVGALRLLPQPLNADIETDIDVCETDRLFELLDRVKPDVVINCVGLIKQLADADEPLAAISINSLLPHQLARACRAVRSRLIHVSTDCVFDGAKGNYRETDVSDAKDMYGRSKYLGEVGGEGVVTLRTSIIGPELGGAHGLVSWFLAQRSSVRGFTRAIFSGLPSVELARVMRDFVVPRADLSGLYHVSADAISKHDLLCLVARQYAKSIEITPSDDPRIDRSLDSSRFRDKTAYIPPPWPQLVRAMYEFG